MTEIVFSIVGVLVFLLAAPSIFRRRKAKGWMIKGNFRWMSREKID